MRGVMSREQLMSSALLHLPLKSLFYPIISFPQTLERVFAPWSFIYIKGTPEGVVGRYMEELEGDDGNRDFGSVSRGASDLQRRKAGDGMEYIDWGEHGYVPPRSFRSGPMRKKRGANI